MKIVTIVGARPQFIKAAMVSRAFSAREKSVGQPVEHVIAYTGQHYDDNLPRVFFEELDIPPPRHRLGVGSLPHGAQTGRMLEALERVLVTEKPDQVVVYGDTNSTLAGALAAKKLNHFVAHVEAGVRSFNLRMAEELNRAVVDRISDALFCPSQTAVDNLRREGITMGVKQVGDVMYDAFLLYRQRARTRSQVMERFRLERKGFVLATVHRAANTDDTKALVGILDGLARVAEERPVVLVLHPRTRRSVTERGVAAHLRRITVIEPVSYLDMLRLEECADVICTDSGGVQREAFFFGVPCITLREETEWVETVDSGWSRLAGSDPDRIVGAVTGAHKDRIDGSKHLHTTATARLPTRSLSC